MKIKNVIKKAMALSAVIMLVFAASCGTDEENKNNKDEGLQNQPPKSEAVQVVESELKGYKAELIRAYVWATSMGMDAKIDISFDEDKVCEAFILEDKEICPYGAGSFYDESKDIYSRLVASQKYDKGKSIRVRWEPTTYDKEIEALRREKFGRTEEIPIDGYFYLVIKEEDNITGLIAFKLPSGEEENGQGNKMIGNYELQTVAAIGFEKIDGDYQNVTMEYIQNRVKEIFKQ